MTECRLPYTCGVCTKATSSLAKNGTVSCRNSGFGTKSASRMTKKSPLARVRAWLMFPALAPLLDSRRT